MDDFTADFFSAVNGMMLHMLSLRVIGCCVDCKYCVLAKQTHLTKAELMNTSLIGFGCAMTLLAGCATAYQPQGLSGGFTETQLDTNVWRVLFKGNGYTRGEKAEDFAMLRSAELTLANGFSHFAFAESKTGNEVSAYTAPTTSYTTANASVYGNSVRGTATTQTYGGGTTFISKPSAKNVVVMFNGKPNTGGLVFDAQFICNSMGQKYKVVCNAPKS
jgi:hypothetical protein